MAGGKAVIDISTIHTPDGYANITEVFRPEWATWLSLSNCFFYLICYTLYFICMAAFLIRLRMKGVVIKRNPKILFGLAITFVAIQSCNLLSRVIFDSMNLKGREVIDKGELVTYSYLIAMLFFGTLSTFFLLLNLLMLFVILYYCQSIFWKTASIIRAISKERYRRIRITTNIVSPFLFFGVSLLILAVTALYPFNEMKVISSTGFTILFVLIFVIFIALLLYFFVMVISSGVFIVRAVRKTSSSARRMKGTTSHNPLSITFALLVGLIACVIIELLAIGIGSIITTNLEEYKGVWQFFNCLGILIFAVIILFLFYPMFVDTEKVVSQFSDTESQISNHEKRIPVPSSVASFSESPCTTPSLGITVI